MGKENFKRFVKANPQLLRYVQSGKKSWQDFYEMYDIYGEDDKVWGQYLYEDNSNLFEFMKNIDFESIQTGVNSVQRVVSLLQDMVNNKEKDDEIKPRPLYKHFED